jgi:hypothetical protein
MSVGEMLEGGQSGKGRSGLGMRHELNNLQVNEPEYAVKFHYVCNVFSRHL